MKKTLSIILSTTLLTSTLSPLVQAETNPPNENQVKFVEVELIPDKCTLDHDHKRFFEIDQNGNIEIFDDGTLPKPDEPEVKAAAIELRKLNIIKDLRFEDNTTRAEFAKMACMFMGYTDDYVAKDSFDDVPKSHWAYSYISYLKEQGLVQGTSENTFEPDEDILLCDALKIIIKNLNFEFYADRYGYPEGYVKAAEWGQILTDAPSPETTVTRGEMFKIVQKSIHSPYLMEYISEQGNLTITIKNDGDGNPITPYSKYFSNNS